MILTTEEPGAGDGRYGFFIEDLLGRWDQEWRVQREARERRLASRVRLLTRVGLFGAGRTSSLSGVDEAAQYAMSGAVTNQVNYRMGVVVPSNYLARERKNEPRPVLARLASRNSELPLRMLTVAWLWGVEHDEDPPLGLRWEDALFPTNDRQPVKSRRRAVLRAQGIIDQVLDEYHAEMDVWRAKGGEIEPLAWVTPRRPNVVVLPSALWACGWYLTLEKDELAWLLAGYVAPEAQNRMRLRYFGFTKHVNGLAVAKLARQNIRESATGYILANLLRELSGLAPTRWPDMTFRDGEYPVGCFRATEEGSEVFVVVTTFEYRVYNFDVADLGWNFNPRTIPNGSDDLPAELRQSPTPGSLILSVRNTNLREFANVRAP